MLRFRNIFCVLAITGILISGFGEYYNAEAKPIYPKKSGTIKGDVNKLFVQHNVCYMEITTDDGKTYVLEFEWGERTNIAEFLGSYSSVTHQNGYVQSVKEVQ